MKVVAILQARMNSSRLPGKMLLPLLDKPLVQHVIERTMRATKLDAVVLAYPDADHDVFFPIVKAIAHDKNKMGYTNYHGSEHDLVGRYLHAADMYNADIIIRIPCDNPCADPAYIDDAIRSYLALPRVYVSTMYAHVRDRVYFDGIGAEVISYSRLQWLDQATAGDAYRREHPHMLFQDQHLIDGWEQYQRYANVSETIRLDVNEEKDYLFIKDIYDHFQRNDFTAAEIVAYLDSKKVPA